MVEILNFNVYDLEESVIACRNSMRVTLPEYTKAEFVDALQRASKLAPMGNGHNNFLCGIRVSYDIKYPQYLSMELQRYHFNDIVSSSSKMHRLAKMNISDSCNKYVCDDVKYNLQALVSKYNEEQTYENFMRVISNCPMGLELFMRCTTNYLQLRNIYQQRRHHKLKEDWGAFCDWIESLPYAKELILSTK